MLLSLVLLVAVGLGPSAAQHVRGAPAIEEQQRRKDGGSRFLASLNEFSIKNETEYSSCPEGYPSYGRLGDLLTAWSPNQPDVPEGGVIERLQVRWRCIAESRVLSTTSSISTGGCRGCGLSYPWVRKKNANRIQRGSGVLTDSIPTAAYTTR